MASRSRKSQSGAESSGNASMSCWAVQAAVGCSVIRTWTMCGDGDGTEDEDEEDASGEGWDGEEVHRHHGRQVIREEGAPGL